MSAVTNNKAFQIAAEFWDSANIIPVYPLQVSDLEQAAFLLYPVNIIKLNQLTLSAINQWLATHNFYPLSATEDKQLFGLLFVHKGHAFIFIDGTAGVKEQLFTLSHELAHYIIEIDRPRKQAIAQYGPDIGDVFDGLRQPNISEQFAGIVSRVGVRPYLHLLEKPEMDSESRWKVWQAENAADSLAWELLAPESLVKEKLLHKGILLRFNELKQFLPVLLSESFQLPDAIAKLYANKLTYRWTKGGPSVAEWLGMT